MTEIQATIEKQLSDHAVVLYMKGTPSFPMCGFSGQVVNVLKQHHVPFHAINVLEDQAIREGIKTHASWPTIPQLYIKGEFIGGCDIVCALDASGELKALLDQV